MNTDGLPGAVLAGAVSTDGGGVQAAGGGAGGQGAPVCVGVVAGCGGEGGQCGDAGQDEADVYLDYAVGGDVRRVWTYRWAEVWAGRCVPAPG
mgnify:CR=1 FL=1